MSVQRAASAGAWSAIDIVLRQGIAFVVAIVLARLLSPEDFGLIAILAFFSGLSTIFIQGGLSIALVQRVDSTHEEESTAFWANLSVGIAFALLLIAIAPAIARWYRLPLLNPLMFVAAAQVVLSALGAVQTALLTRDLRFDQLTKTGIAASVLSGLAGTMTAVAGWGVWALAVQILTLAATSTLALWLVSDWRPACIVRIPAIRSLASFGAHVSLSVVLDSVFSNGIILVLGKLYGVRELGIWNRAAIMTGFPTGIISAIVARTALPLFAARADDPAALVRGLRLAVQVSMFLTLPMIIGFCLTSELVVVVLIGDKWIAAAPYMTLLVLAGAVLPMQILNLQLLLAAGRSKEFLSLEIKKKVVGVILLGVGALIGLTYLAYAYIAFSALALAINTSPTKRFLDYGLYRQLADIRGVLFCVFLMGLAVAALDVMISAHPATELVILTGSGCFVYFSTAFVFKVQALAEAQNLAWPLLSRVFHRSKHAIDARRQNPLSK